MTSGHSRVPAIVCAASAFVLALAGLQSKLLADWWLENLAIAAFFAALAWSWQRDIRLSSASLWMLFALLCLHEYGAAYAYATPVGEWMKQFLGPSRNHYDRLVHFLYGALTIRGFREAAKGSTLIALQSVLATSALYEILEWLVAAVVDPGLGAEFVGAQGDDFDAPKDMALAFCGALLMAQWVRKK